MPNDNQKPKKKPTELEFSQKQLQKEIIPTMLNIQGTPIVKVEAQPVEVIPTPVKAQVEVSLQQVKETKTKGDGTN